MYIHVHTCRLRDFSEWGQCQVLQLLLRYKCANEEEVFDILVSEGREEEEKEEEEEEEEVHVVGSTWSPHASLWIHRMSLMIG